MDVSAIIKMAVAGDTEGCAAALKALLNKKKDEITEDATRFMTASILEADDCDDDELDADGKPVVKPAPNAGGGPANM